MKLGSNNIKNGSISDLDSQILFKLAQCRMPYGKYVNRLLIDLPEPYVVWFANKGFPKGELGEMLAMVYEIKVNGLEYLFESLRQAGKESGR